MQERVPGLHIKLVWRPYGKHVACCWGFLIALSTPVALAHTLAQKIGGYADNRGATRQRLAYELGAEPRLPTAPFTKSRFDLDYTRDRVQYSNLSENDYQREVYQTDYRVNNAAAFSATQTWGKLTDTRQALALASDGTVHSKTYGLGASQWLWHESLRLSLDLSRTMVNQPYFPTLDYDSVSVANPELVTSAGAIFAIRHIASPTTILDYSYGQVLISNRPTTHVGGVAVRQFVPEWDGAVHVGATRAINRGHIGTDTSYGQVDAWIEEVALLKTLWQGALAKLSYRRYVEDETTRAYAEQLRFGSDTVAAGFTQDLPSAADKAIGTPLALEASASRYQTNTAVAARVFEAGISAKF